MGLVSKWAETSALGGMQGPAHWARPAWRPTGSPARLVYVVVGAFPDGSGLRIDRALKDSPVATALQARLVTREANAAFVSNWTSGALGALLKDQLGAEAAERAAAAPAVLFLQAEIPDPKDLGYLRDALQLLSRALNEHSVAVLDMYGAHWLAPDTVRQTATSTGFRVREHLYIVAAKDERGGLWMHSRGAIKLGRPELEIRGIRPDARALKGAALVLEGALKLLAEGLEPTDGGNYAIHGFNNHFTVVTSPDDSQTTQYYKNRSVALYDCNALTGKPEQVLSALLGEAEQRVKA